MTHSEIEKRSLDKFFKVRKDNYPEVEAGFIEGKPFLIYGEHDEKTRNQFFNALNQPSGVSGTLCADGHFGYGQPIGSAISYRGLSLSGVGYDAGCGVSAAKLSRALDNDLLMENLDVVEGVLRNSVNILNRSSDEGLPNGYLTSVKSSMEVNLRSFKIFSKEEEQSFIEMSQSGLGTLGNGNHFLNLALDSDESLNLIVHSGSRSVGHAVMSKFYEMYGAKDSDENPTIIPANDPNRQKIMNMIAMLESYANYNRTALNSIVNYALCKEFGEKYENGSYYHINSVHNNVRAESMTSVTSFKGCINGYQGLVASSMKDPVYYVQAKEYPFTHERVQTPRALPHGAGRLLSRRQARKNTTREELNQQMKDLGVRLVGGDSDESPIAYRDVNDVVKSHGCTISEVFTPVVVVMA